MNCPNCNAPVIKQYCEYCGTRFGMDPADPKGDTLVIPVYIGNQQVDEIIKAYSNFARTAYEIGGVFK